MDDQSIGEVHAEETPSNISDDQHSVMGMWFKNGKVQKQIKMESLMSGTNRRWSTQVDKGKLT